MPTTKTDDRRRPERVASRVKQEISTALQRDLGDPRLANVVLSHVDVTDDLSIARIAIVVLGDDETASKAKTAARLLQKLEGGLRKHIASKLAMRRVPSLRFTIDEGRKEASRLDELLDEVSRELKPKRGARDE